MSDHQCVRGLMLRQPRSPRGFGNGSPPDPHANFDSATVLPIPTCRVSKVTSSVATESQEALKQRTAILLLPAREKSRGLVDVSGFHNEPISNRAIWQVF